MRRHVWLVALATVALVAGASWWFLDSDSGVPLPDNGATITTVAHGRPVFVRRDASEVTAFVADPHHLDDETLWWCEDESAFFAPAHGELFDSDGVAVAGPARRGLDRLVVVVDGETVRIRGNVTPGAPRDRSRDVHNLADALGDDAAATYRRDTENFCANPLEPPEAGRGWWDRLRQMFQDMTGGHDAASTSRWRPGTGGEDLSLPAG